MFLSQERAVTSPSSKRLARYVDIAPKGDGDDLPAHTIAHGPTVSVVDQADRGDFARGGRSGVEADAAARADGHGKGRNAGVGWLGLGREDLKALAGARHLVAHAVGQGFADLANGATGGFGQAQGIEMRGWGVENDRQSFGFVAREPGEPCAVVEAELEPALIALIGNERL